MACAATTIVSILGLIVALLTTALVPVDIFLVSSFKDTDGTFHVSKGISPDFWAFVFGFVDFVLLLCFHLSHHVQEWASDDIRSQIKTTLTDGYYGVCV